jgi:excisionase family DNA binding protein
MKKNVTGNATPPMLVSIGVAAATLGVSVRFIRRHIWDGDLPSVKLGRRVLIRSSDLAAVVERGSL